MPFQAARRTLQVTLGLVTLALLVPSALAQTSLKWAHVYEISEPYHSWALWAAEEIGKRTDGRHTIEVFPASSLGKESDINQGLGLGLVDIIYTGQLFASRFYGPIGIGGAPYMFRDHDHWVRYRDSGLFAELAKGYEDATGNKVIALTYYGERQITSNKPLLKPEDLQGLKLRVPDAPLYRMFAESVGANATPIAFAEVYLALQTGTVDAQENPLPTIQAKKFYEVQKHIALTGHITDALLTIVSGQTWEGLEDADKEIFTAVLKEAADKCTQDIVKKQDELAAWFDQHGVTVDKVDREPFRQAAVKLHNGSAATWDQATYDRLQALR
jgi:tripartite ATP-independent transporter DctP family solute receptor